MAAIASSGREAKNIIDLLSQSFRDRRYFQYKKSRGRATCVFATLKNRGSQNQPVDNTWQFEGGPDPINGCVRDRARLRSPTKAERNIPIELNRRLL
jgi:hypothetical protein